MASNVKINVTADGAGFNRVMNSVENRVKSLGTSIKGHLAGAFGTAAIGAVAQQIIQYAGAIKDASEQLGITITQTQALKIIAEDAGGALENMAAMLEKVNSARNDALGGDAGKSAIFAGLGISRGQLAG